jgi:hypothetical protein
VDTILAAPCSDFKMTWPDGYDTQAAVYEALAVLSLGDAELALGRLSAATAAFDRAGSVAHAIGLPFQHDVVAGRARVVLALGDVAQAMRWTEALLAHLAGGGTLDAGLGAALIGLTSTGC